MASRYSPNLSKRCTHLVAPDLMDAPSQKWQAAAAQRTKWQLGIVAASWVARCHAAGALVPEQPPAVGGGVAAPQPDSRDAATAGGRGMSSAARLQCTNQHAGSGDACTSSPLHSGRQQDQHQHQVEYTDCQQQPVAAERRKPAPWAVHFSQIADAPFVDASPAGERFDQLQPLLEEQWAAAAVAEAGVQQAPAAQQPWQMQLGHAPALTPQPAGSDAPDTWQQQQQQGQEQQEQGSPLLLVRRLEPQMEAAVAPGGAGGLQEPAASSPAAHSLLGGQQLQTQPPSPSMADVGWRLGMHALSHREPGQAATAVDTSSGGLAPAGQEAATAHQEQQAGQQAWQLPAQEAPAPNAALPHQVLPLQEGGSVQRLVQRLSRVHGGAAPPSECSAAAAGAGNAPSCMTRDGALPAAGYASPAVQPTAAQQAAAPSSARTQALIQSLAQVTSDMCSSSSSARVSAGQQPAQPHSANDMACSSPAASGSAAAGAGRGSYPEELAQPPPAMASSPDPLQLQERQQQPALPEAAVGPWSPQRPGVCVCGGRR